MQKERALSRNELRKIRPSMRHLYISQKEHLSLTQKFATWITEAVGTMGFFYLLVLWTVIWMGWNVLAPENLRFDTVPTFLVWIFISNVMQLFFLPIIMVGQNLQGFHADARAQADFELNQIAEKEIDTVLIHLEDQNEQILNVTEKTDKILKHLENQNDLIINILNELKAGTKNNGKKKNVESI